MNRDIENFISYLLRNVSPHLRDDCRQAAYFGVLKIARRFDPEKASFSTFMRANRGYIQDEILREVAKLSLPFVISKPMLLDLYKYNRGETKKMSDARKKVVGKLSTIKTCRYDSDAEA